MQNADLEKLVDAAEADNPSLKAKDFSDRAHELKEQLDDGLKRVDAIDDPTLRSVALIKLREELGLRANEFLRLVELLSKFKGEQPPEDFDELVEWTSQRRQPPVVEDLLGSNCLTLFAAEGSSGKSSAAYEIAEAITTGGKFAGQFQAQVGDVVFIQEDESPSDASVKWRRMGLNPNGKRLHMMWSFTPMMLPELKAKIKATNAKAVVMDALVSIAGGTISPKDAEFALLLYRLNKLASELGVSILLIHHLTKESKRQEVTKEAIFGSAFIYAATADCWGYWRCDDEGNTQFKMRMLKARSNTVELNTTYVFRGNAEDHRLTFKGFGDRVVSIDELKTKCDKVAALLHQDRSRKCSGAAVSEHFGWNGAGYADNVLAKLYEQRCGVDRVATPSTGGRRRYAYFSVLGGEVEKSGFHTSSTHSENGSKARRKLRF